MSGEGRKGSFNIFILNQNSSLYIILTLHVVDTNNNGMKEFVLVVEIKSISTEPPPGCVKQLFVPPSMERRVRPPQETQESCSPC